MHTLSVKAVQTKTQNYYELFQLTYVGWDTFRMIIKRSNLT